MIVENGKYYLYRHIKSDDGYPFYIGIGQKDGRLNKKFESEYKRAFVTFTRSSFWKNIYKKHGRDVEILLESDSKSFIEQKEREFISMHGRIDIGSGILVNLTDGGDYYPLDKKHAHKCKNNLSKEQRIKIIGNVHINVDGTTSKMIWVYDSKTGYFIKSFKQIKLAGKELNICSPFISACAKKRVTCKGKYIFSFTNLGDICNTSFFNQNKNQEVPVYKICPQTKTILCEFDTMSMAAKSVKACTSNILSAVNKKIRCNSFYWIRKSDYVEGVDFWCKRNRFQKIVKIDPKTNCVVNEYNSIKEATYLNKYKSDSNIKQGIKNGSIRYGFIWRKK